MELSEKLQLFFSGGSPAPVPLDPDAEAYILRVEDADGESLEPAVKKAINDFVLGVKADGDWPALKASCILAGARTLNGALEPLVGVAPTSFNFVGTDYNRKTGLKGDGATKYLDTKRLNDADPQDNNHNAVYRSLILTSGTARFMMAAGNGAVDSNALFVGSTGSIASQSRAGSDFNARVSANQTLGFFGHSRSVSANYQARNGGLTETFSEISAAPGLNAIQIFARQGQLITDERLSFYSAGEALSLANLDTRVTTLMNALNAAI